jgi:ABC-type antimicrobial peptide transport system permease subunit
MPSVRSGLLRIDSNLPYARMRTLREMAEPDMRPWRLGSTLFVVFGAAALLVATMGVYALLSFMVTQRSREIGVRLALGATPAATLRLVLRQSLGWVVIGLVAGACIALAAGRFVRPLLFETSPYDPVVLAGSAAMLALVAVAASLAPAVRASRIDPNITLRAE